MEKRLSFQHMVLEQQGFHMQKKLIYIETSHPSQN